MSVARPIAADSAGTALQLRVTIEAPARAPLTRSCVCEALRIGRDPAADLTLEDSMVSRQHAIVRASPDSGLEIEDVSSNGTLVDGRLLHGQRRSVPAQCTLLVGATLVHLRRMGAAPKAERPSPDRELHGEATRARRSAPREVPGEPVQEHTLGSAGLDLSALRRRVHETLLKELDLSSFDPQRRDDPTLRPRVLEALRRIVAQLASELPSGVTQDALVGEVADEALGLGPLEHLLADPRITEIMVIDPETIYIERKGRLSLSGCRFTDGERIRAVIERIVSPLGRRVDESSPIVDARLPDGSRVNIVIPPLALRGAAITIRKFARAPLDFETLCRLGSLDARMARFLERCVRAKKNLVISGGTGSGKTTLLNVLSRAIPDSERIVTIEDAAELELYQPHVVSLESRPPNAESKGEVTIRDLVRNALRMRPDRIIVGECRGGEALDMLQAMNTGHAGSLTTTHANSPIEALSRLETLCMMAGLGLPQAALRAQLARSVDVIVQQQRFADGARRIVAIVEMAGVGADGNIRLRPIFRFARTGSNPDGSVAGSFRSTGYLPSFLHDMLVQGIVGEGEAAL